MGRTRQIATAPDGVMLEITGSARMPEIWDDGDLAAKLWPGTITWTTYPDVD